MAAAAAVVASKPSTAAGAGNGSSASAVTTATSTDAKSGTTTVTAKLANGLPASFESLDDIERVCGADIKRVRAKLQPNVKAEADAVDDIFVYRFLRGYKFDVDAAAKALQHSLEWRAANGMNALRDRSAHLTQLQYPFADKVHRCCALTHAHGRDRFGQPLAIERMGRCKTDLLTRLMTVDQLRQYHHVNMERKYAQLAADTKAAGKLIRFAKIVDLEGLSAKQLDREAFKYLQMVLHEGQTHYPEGMGHLYLVNVPWLFHVAWAMVRPFVNDAALSKMTICGDDWKHVLQRDIDPSSLPVFLGGTCECKHIGGCIPEVDPDAGYAEQKLKAGDKFAHSVDVAPGSLVSYEFRTRAHDIGFSVTCQPKPTVATGGKTPPLITLKPFAKVNAGSKMQTDTLDANTGGTFTFHWDNTHSWMTEKQLLWRVDVVKPDTLSAAPAPAPAPVAAADPVAVAVTPPPASTPAPSAATK